MADICMCLDKRCPSRTLCYRFTAERNEHWQACYAKSPRKAHAMRCSAFWSNKGTPDPTDYTVSQISTRKGIKQLKVCKEYTRRGATKKKVSSKGYRKCSRRASMRNRKCS